MWTAPSWCCCPRIPTPRPGRCGPRLRERYGLDVAVIISDTMGRPWRNGLTDVALGAAGIDADPRPPRRGRPVRQRAAASPRWRSSTSWPRAAELVKGKCDQVPVAVVRGYLDRADAGRTARARSALVRDSAERPVLPGHGRGPRRPGLRAPADPRPTAPPAPAAAVGRTPGPDPGRRAAGADDGGADRPWNRDPVRRGDRALIALGIGRPPHPVRPGRRGHRVRVQSDRRRRHHRGMSRPSRLALSTGGPCPTASRRCRARFLELCAARRTRCDRPSGAHLTATVMVVHADLERVLLCLHGRIRRWVQLGGHLEPADDTLAAAALREATEESGIAGIRLHPVPDRPRRPPGRAAGYGPAVALRRAVRRRWRRRTPYRGGQRRVAASWVGSPPTSCRRRWPRARPTAAWSLPRAWPASRRGPSAVR